MKRFGLAVMVITVSCLLCGFTLFGGDISDAKKVTVPLGNKRIEAGSLIDDYRYFKNVKWVEEKQNNGSTIISATAEYDAIYTSATAKPGSAGTLPAQRTRKSLIG